MYASSHKKDSASSSMECCLLQYNKQGLDFKMAQLQYAVLNSAGYLATVYVYICLCTHITHKRLW